MLDDIFLRPVLCKVVAGAGAPQIMLPGGRILSFCGLLNERMLSWGTPAGV
jgi:hypothetical protein